MEAPSEWPVPPLALPNGCPLVLRGQKPLVSHLESKCDAHRDPLAFCALCSVHGLVGDRALPGWVCNSILIYRQVRRWVFIALDVTFSFHQNKSISWGCNICLWALAGNCCCRFHGHHSYYAPESPKAPRRVAVSWPAGVGHPHVPLGTEAKPHVTL